MTADTRRTWIAAVLVALLAILAAASMAGCDSRTYLGAVADLRAGAQAAQQTTDAAARSRLYTAIGRRILALTDSIPDLPKPEQDPAAIVADPDTYCAATPPAPAYEAPPPPPPSPWQRFRSLGDSLVFWGGIVCAAGAVLSLVGWVAGRAGWAGLVWSIIGSPITAGVARLGASLGGASALLGAGVVWAVTYWWAIVIAVVLAVAGAGFYHRKDIARLWARISRGKA